MASKFPTEGGKRVKLSSTTCHDVTWLCDKHNEPIAVYCKKHDIPICHRCANEDHGQTPCELDDIKDVILEKMRKLDDKQREIEETKKQLKTLDSKIESIVSFSSNHLQTVNDEVKSTHKEKSKIVKDDEVKKIRLINDEADEQIRIVNEKRYGRIKACNAEIENKQVIIKESQATLILQTKAISEDVYKNITDLKSKNQQAISTLDNIDSKIKRMKQDDKTLVNETPQVLASLNDNLIDPQDVSDCLGRVQDEVQRVKFVEGEVGREHHGRIDGYIGKWGRVKSVHISIAREPDMFGLISDDEICVTDRYDDNNDDVNSTYVIDINNEQTQKVIEGYRGMYITSCVPIGSNVVVCGKRRRDCADDILRGCITLYDRQWKVIRDISIPMHNHSRCSVSVDVDRDGMILAAQIDQSNIYVINPADGNIVDTITIQGKDVKHEIQALSSGDIVVNTGDKDFTVISRSGAEKATIHYDEWKGSSCHVDKLTDRLYITYWLTYTCAVDQVSCDGIIQARRIFEYGEWDRMDRSFITSPCFVSPSGNLVASVGNKIDVYKKRFIV